MSVKPIEERNVVARTVFMLRAKRILRSLSAAWLSSAREATNPASTIPSTIARLSPSTQTRLESCDLAASRPLNPPSNFRKLTKQTPLHHFGFQARTTQGNAVPSLRSYTVTLQAIYAWHHHASEPATDVSTYSFSVFKLKSNFSKLVPKWRTTKWSLKPAKPGHRSAAPHTCNAERLVTACSFLLS